MRFKGKFGALDRKIIVNEPAEDFYFPLPERPEIVRLDPELTLLAKINFRPPTAMLHAQLADSTDMLGRLLAVEQLSGKREALDRLQAALGHDPFYGVRLAASKAIRAVGSDEALEALLKCLNESAKNAQVRERLVTDATSFYRQKSWSTALKIADEDDNPDIQAVAITALGACPSEQAKAKMVDFLSAPSFRNVLADAAIAAMRSQDDPVYVEPLLACLRTNETAFTTRGFSRALDTLAWLARHDEHKERVREFLLSHINHPKDHVQRAVISALGTLGDSQAIAALERFTYGDEDSPLRTAADKAVAALREERKPAVEFRAMRKEVLDLQRANRDLRKELDDLKKQVEAATSREQKATAP